MIGDRAKRLAQLRRAYENGILDEDTYRSALAGVEAQAATLSGSGGIAQDHSVAAGAAGVAVGRDVHGNIYVGPRPRDKAEALRIYRQVLVHTARHLPLRGVDLGASDPTAGRQRFDLAQVYIELDTTTKVPLSKEEEKKRDWRVPGEMREMRLLSALEATAAQRHLVLLGDPGSGKSTFLGHLALCLALHSLEPQAQWLARLPCWPEDEAGLVPIPVILRDFSRWLPDSTTRAEPRHLWDFILSRLKSQNLAFASESLHDALERGQALVLLDGLDEIPTKEQRTFARDAVVAFAERYRESRLAVNCRTLSYQDTAWQLEGFPHFELAPFDKEKIDHFIGAWYVELARLGAVKPEEVESLIGRLQEAVRHPDLWRLAPNPLLLTVMALVHTHKGRLPDGRSLLYEDTVDILLWRWEQVKAGGDEEAPRLRQLLLGARRTDVDLKRVLWRLAFEAHREGGSKDQEVLADIGELRLQKALAGLHPEGSLDWAQQVIAAMKVRAGLLLERAPEIFTFPHRTFQEYLAGAHLSSQADFARQAVALVEEGAFWREAVLLAVGRLVYQSGDTDKPLALVGELCPARAVDTDVAWQKAWLASEALLEIGLNRAGDSALGRDLTERVRDRVVALLTQGRLTPVERVEAGNVLARLGDPRFRADAWFLPAEELLGFVEIPAGPFSMGTRVDERQAWDGGRDYFERETVLQDVSLCDYYMARYPVTQAQYWAFVQASGRKPPVAGATWEQLYEWVDGRPAPHLHNHPVVLVTWHDARAYCRWLDDILRKWKHSPEPLATLLGTQSWEVRLSDEAEWEKAARGTDERVYPWGDESDPNRANYRDTGIGATSPVGCFPTGCSFYGVEDLSGNVREWTQSEYFHSSDPREYGQPTERRVWRGGSFLDTAQDIRCASRNWELPGRGQSTLGFRVIVAPTRTRLQDFETVDSAWEGCGEEVHPLLT